MGRRKDKKQLDTVDAFSGDGKGMRSGSHGHSLISGWRSSDNGRMCIVNLGITEYSRLHPFASGAALPPASTPMPKGWPNHIPMARRQMA